MAVGDFGTAVAQEIKLRVGLHRLSLPGLPAALPFNLYRDATGRVVHDYTPETRTGTTLYLSSSGNDANDGLTPATALRTMQAVVPKVVAGSGDYVVRVLDAWVPRERSDSAGLTLTGGRCLTIIGDGPDGYSWMAANNSGALTWTADGANTWQATRSAVQAVFKAQLDANGVPTPLAPASSVATCQATADSWYTDGTSVWVNTGGAAPTPTSHHVCLVLGVLNATLNGGATLRHRNLRYLIANSGLIQSTDFTGKFESVNSYYVGGWHSAGSTTNALDVKNLERVLLFGCFASYGGRDGFNYSAFEAPLASNPARLMFEYECKSVANGVPQKAASNASTAHQALTMVRVGGTYVGNNGGPAVMDVHGSHSVLIGCAVTEPGPTQTNALDMTEAGQGLVWDCSLTGAVPLAAGATPVVVKGSLRASAPAAITGTAITFSD